MELKNNQITVGELLKHPGARQVLSRRFPALVGSPALTAAAGWSLSRVIRFAKGKVPDSQIQAALEDLRRL